MLSEVAFYAQVAQRAVMEAMNLARENFGQTLDSVVKGPRGDLVTKVDHAAEELIIGILRKTFPTHAIHAEESGWLQEESEFVWLVDPLDGTNNYAYGLPLYGAAVTLCRDGEPIVAAIGDAHTSDIACAVQGGGVMVNGKSLKRAVPHATDLPATALWIGYEAEYDSLLAAINGMLHTHSRRVFSTWAPTIDVFLYLRGGLDAIAVYRCGGTELLGSLLVLKEAGGEHRTADGRQVPRLRDLPELSFVGDPSRLGALINAYARPATR